VDTASVTLSWSCDDPDGDPLTYSLLLQNDLQNYLIDTIAGLTDTSYTIDSLHPDIFYNWKIDAEDEHGALTSGNWWFFVTEDVVVNFPDIALEIAVREYLELPVGDIHASDLHYIYEFDVSHHGIQLLDGMQYMYQLHSLRLENNLISGLAPLSQLSWLNGLYLDNNKVSELSPLSQLTDLEYLSSNNNQITDISSLSNMTGLESLYLFNNYLTDISPIAQLVFLHNLGLDSNYISDVSPLSDLILLHFVYLSSNQITDIESLANNLGLNYLDVIYLYDNPLDSMSINVYIPTLEARGVEVFY